MSTSARPAKPTVMLTVDDHPLIRSALRQVLAKLTGRIELIEASNPEEGLAVLGRRSDADLIFLDLNFPRHDGLAFVRRFRAAAPAAPLIIYTMYEDLPTLRQALAHGAVGIVPKTHSAALLRRAIEVVLDGGMYLPPHLGWQLASREADPAGRPQAGAMSQRQWRILELLAQGLPNKEIGRKLGITSNTVKNQLTMMFEKLRVSNRTQAAVAAHALVSSGRKAARDETGPELGRH